MGPYILTLTFVGAAILGAATSSPPDATPRAALYLASDESSVVTGTDVVIGGGNLLQGPHLEQPTAPVGAGAAS